MQKHENSITAVQKQQEMITILIAPRQANNLVEYLL